MNAEIIEITDLRRKKEQDDLYKTLDRFESICNQTMESDELYIRIMIFEARIRLHGKDKQEYEELSDIMEMCISSCNKCVIANQN